MSLYHWNPCKLGRHPSLVKIGDALAAFYVDWFETPTDGCPCCMAIRILLFGATLGLSGLGTGVLVGALL